jgi:hypothetical protein
MLGPLYHLGPRRISNYTEEIVRSFGSLWVRMGHGVEIAPLVFVPLGRGGGVNSLGWIRDAFDLDSWILASGPGRGSPCWSRLPEEPSGRP